MLVKRGDTRDPSSNPLFHIERLEQNDRWYLLSQINEMLLKSV